MAAPTPDRHSLPISDYALIGDTRSTALVSRDGSIDWLCLPRHDSPAVFLRLLDPDGGCCRVEVNGLQRSARRYLSDTNVLETTLECETGTLVATDFMPVRAKPEPVLEGPDCDAPGALMRMLRCSRGTVAGRVIVKPTFDFARSGSGVLRNDGGTARFDTPDLVLRVASYSSFSFGNGQFEVAFALAEGETWHLSIAGSAVPEQDPETLLSETVSYWRGWADQCTYRGVFHDAVLRSVLCLKLLTYGPSGAIVAAATAGLPEAVGGPRNWDYRYAWLRDASFTVGAFLNLGFRHEAAEFLRFLRDADRSRGSDLRILYAITPGHEPVAETSLDHLRGWRASRPVMIGNGASGQDQHDIYGEFLSALRLYLEAVGDDVPGTLRDGLPELVSNLARAAERRWHEPDRGIWELRTESGHFFHSLGMCHLALDSAVALSPRLGLSDEDRDRWAALRDRIWSELHERCWDEDRQAYVAGYELRELDAAVLRCTLFGANDLADPRLAATVAAIERELAHGPHVYRYRMADGLDGNEGAFFACSFWLAGNWALLGDTLRARERMAQLIGCANDVGLLSEEIDPETGELLGNFPQGFSHMALINGLIRLERAVDQHGLR